jgi:hypothetical protein
MEEVRDDIPIPKRREKVITAIAPPDRGEK